MISRKNNKKGFTLMEMLIVVAIIVILIAIMIPTFNGQLEKTREAADAANIRAEYAELMVKYLDGETDTSKLKADVTLQQKEAGWSNTQLATNLKTVFAGEANATVIDAVTAGQKITVSVDTNGNPTLK